MKIVFYEKIPKDQNILEELLKQNPATKNLEAVYVPEKLNADNISIAKDADIIGVFVNSELKKEQIDQLLKLKLIATLSTGFDHIDIAYANSKNITVVNVPAYGSRTVAEFTFALILGLSRKTFAAYRQIKDSHDFSIAHFEGFNLQGKTLGITGTGKIGLNVAKIAKGFEMQILAFDAFPNKAAEKEIGFNYSPLDELLSKSDIVTLHVPYNKDTHHLINQNNISKFKKGAMLINTSRGEVADTEAILIGIKQGTLSAVGLDVIEKERLLQDEWQIVSADKKHEQDLKTVLEDNMLIELPEVAYTPHIAFFTKEAKHEILNTSVENIAGFLQGNPKNIVK